MRKKLLFLAAVCFAFVSVGNAFAVNVESADVIVYTKNMHQYIKYLMCNQLLVEKCSAFFVTDRGLQFSFTEKSGWSKIKDTATINKNRSVLNVTSLSSFQVNRNNCILSGTLKKGSREGNAVSVSEVFFPMSSDIDAESLNGDLVLEFSQKEKKYVVRVSLRNSFYDKEYAFISEFKNVNKVAEVFFDTCFYEKKHVNEINELKFEFERLLYSSVSPFYFNDKESKENVVPYPQLNVYVLYFLRNCFDGNLSYYESRNDDHTFKISEKEGADFSNVANRYLYIPEVEKIGYEKYGFYSPGMIVKKHEEYPSAKIGMDVSGFLSAVIALSKAGENSKTSSLRSFYENNYYYWRQEKNIFSRKTLYAENVYSRKEMYGNTLIVPSFDELQKGDFLISENKNGEYSAAVIVGFGGKEKTPENVWVAAAPCKEGEYLRRITWAELDEQQPHYPRRFLKYDSSRSNGKNQKISGFSSAVFSESLKDAVVVFDQMYEENQITASKIRWNYLPNTGESLCLYNPRIVSSKNGQPVCSALDEMFCVDHISLYDRILDDWSYSVNSPSSSFDLKIHLENDLVLDYGKYFKGTAEEYRMEKKNPYEIFIDKNSGRLYVSIKGRNFFIKEFLIKPLDQEASVPGDDLVVALCIKNSLDSKTVSKMVYADEESFVSVYDKKLLWRANLYLNERVDSVDWNILHPWNSAENEWNKICTPSSNFATTGTLETGDGTQVVSFCEYTPFRTTGKNITNTVPYDYNICASVNAWDSPFDFMFKMMKQTEALQSHFYKKYKAYVDFKNSGGRIESQSDEFKEKYMELNEAGIFPKNDSEEISGNSIVNFSLSQWNNTAAPNSKWKFYWKDDDVESGVPYVPGVGFYEYLKVHDNKYSVENSTGETNTLLKELKFPKLLGTGTDCIGFVYRAFNYSGRSHMRLDTPKFPKDRAEGNLDPDEHKRFDSEYTLCFPLVNNTAFVVADCAMLYGTLKISNLAVDFFSAEPKESVGEKTPDSVYFENAKKMLLRVIPGDLISYGEQLPKDVWVTIDRCAHSHIGIVDYVDRKKILEAKNYHELFSAIRIIESVFFSSCNYVLKRKMSENGLSDSKDTNWYVSNKVARPWAIHRLKSIHGQY